MDMFDDSEFKSMTEEERKLVLKILGGISKGDNSLYDDLLYSDYSEIPVDISTFMHDKNYLGNALYNPSGEFTVFPYWEKKLKEIFPTPTTTRYNTIIFTGAIGLGKSTIAVICLLYLLYRLLCLKDPYLYYGLQPIDKITISLMNITLENAKGVALDKMNQMILASPWFMSHGEMGGITNLEYRPNKHIELIVASSNNQVIGRALFANFTDEVNFGLTNDVEKLKKKQMQLISQIDARMKSRFMRGTYLPTMNIIASSKNSDQSFLDSYIETKRKNESKNTLIVDEPQWVVDSRKDSKEHFFVAVGNAFLANELLPRNATKELVDKYRSKGYQMLEVPIGYYENFQDNIDGALTDIAGIATASALKYISGARLEDVKTDKYRNAFVKDVIVVGNSKDDFSQYSDFFDLSRIPKDIYTKPLYIHFDMSKTGDKTGIAGIFVIGKRPKVEGEESSKELYYQLGFSVSVEAPKGFEISFDKHRTFIRWLKEQGFKIKGISSDTFQSAQLNQQLMADGFNVSIVSVDRLDSQSKQQLQYSYFKSTLYDRRITIYKDCNLLTEEIIGLERESDGHIQHPGGGTQGCFTGDTKVSLVDGRELTMLELVDEFNSGKENYVYSFNETTKKIEPKLIEKAWCTLKNANLVEVTLDNGEVLRCTPNHRFMLRDGLYKEAKDLEVDDSLMSLYKKSETVEHKEIVDKEILNHKVVSVRYLEETEDVYDLTIKDNHNFALSAGVFVHNSKDQIDAVVGSLWNASLHADEFAYEYGETLMLGVDLSTNDENDININQSLENSLLEIYHQNTYNPLSNKIEKQEAKDRKLGTLSDFYDISLGPSFYDDSDILW